MEQIDTYILIKNLLDNRQFKNYEEVVKFNESLDNIVLLKNPEHIATLFQLIVDDSDHLEVIDGVIHAIEYYGIDYYLPYFLVHLDEIYEQAPVQTKRMFLRILNSEEALMCLREHINVSCPILEVVLLQIEQKSEPHKALCQELIHTLKNQTS